MKRLGLQRLRRAHGVGALLFSVATLGCPPSPQPTKPKSSSSVEPPAGHGGAPPAGHSGASSTGKANVPYQLTLEPFSIEGFPGLHSMVHADLDGKLVLLAGRRNGLHAFPPRTSAELISAFPASEANDRAYVLDLEGKKLLGSASVKALPANIARQLQATNCEYFVKDGKLFVVGGYTTTANGQSMETMQQVVAIDLKALVDTITGGKPLDTAFAKNHIAMGQHPALQITGGGMHPLGENLLLAYGHMYNGLYTTESGLAQQTYSNSVRAFRFFFSSKKTSDGLSQIDVDYRGKFPDPPADKPQPSPDGPYHRRDYTFLSVLAPDGSSQLAAYGGVFKGGRMEGYVTPLFISNSSESQLGFTVKEDTSVTQWLSQYDTAAIPLYSKSQSTAYTAFFGGISQYYWDAATSSLKRDAVDFDKKPPVDGLPFINSISTLKLTATGGQQYLHQGEQFPPVGGEPQCSDQSASYLGSDGAFIARSSVADPNGVVLLDQLQSTERIGTIVGGIAALAPYPGKQTCASSKLYAVSLNPSQATQTVTLVAPSP